MSYKDHLPTSGEHSRRQYRQIKQVQQSSFIAAPPAITETITDTGSTITPPSATENLLNPLLADIEDLSENVATTINIELEKITGTFHRIQLPDVGALTINFIGLVKNKAEQLFLDFTKENIANTPTVTFNPPINGLTQADLDASDRIPISVMARDTEDEIRYDLIGGLNGAVGTQTPWATNIDAATFLLQNLGGIEFRGSTQLGITPIDSGTPDGTYDRLEYDADVLGAHDFYVNRSVTTIPRFGITQTSIESNVLLDMNSNDIDQVDRLIFVQDAGAPSGVGNPQIYVDGIGAGDLVINNVDTEAIIHTFSNKVALQSTESTLQMQAISFLPRINIYKNSIPSTGAVFAEQIYYFDRTTGGKTVGAVISATAEDTSNTLYEGGLVFQIMQAGSQNIFMRMNDAKENTVKIFRDLDANTQDLINVDRLRFVSDSATPASAGDPTIYLDGVSNMVFNIADQKQWFWTNQNETIMQLDRDGVNNDTVLTIETDSTDASAVPRIDIFRDDPSPVIDDEFGKLRFIGTDLALASQVYSEIAVEYESVTTGRIASSMIFVTSFDTGATTQFKPFMAINTANDERIRMIEDVEIVQDIIIQSGFTTSRIFFDLVGDTFLTGASTDDRINVVNNGNNITYFDNGGIVTTQRLLMSETGDPSAPTNAGYFYVKDVGGISKPFYIGDGQVAIDLTAGGAGAQTPWTSDIDADGFDLKDLSNIEFRVSTGVPGTGNNIYATATGIHIRALAVDDAISFYLGASVQLALEEDGELRWPQDGHKLVPQATSFQIISANEGDTVEIWNGTGRTNATLEINDIATTWLTETDDIQAVLLQLIQNHNTPADFRTIANIDLMAENSSSVDTIYARISASSQDVTNATEDGLLQLGVVSAGTLVSGIDIEGGTSDANGAKIGFFGETPVVQQQLDATPTVTEISTALRNLGLTKL